MKPWLPLFLLCLTACQVNKRPDLAWLYQPHSNNQNNTPLILIHGSLGSKLQLAATKEQVWPGKINDLIFSNYKVLANVIDPDTLAVDHSVIESYAIFDSFSGLSIYDDIIQTLTQYGNYQRSELNQTVHTGRHLYVFHYDWRQDMVHNAQLLAAFIKTVLSRHPEKQVDVVAHSMGGLILRYYQRFGDQDVLPDLMLHHDNTKTIETRPHAQYIRHAILLGTPQLGSVKPINRLKAGFDFNLRNIPVEVQVTMPSVYQLLPHPQSQWLVDSNGEPVKLNLYSPQLWQSQQWSIYQPEVAQRITAAAQSTTAAKKELNTLQAFFNHQLKRASAFWQSLSTEYEVEHEGFIVMGSSCKPTLNRMIYEKQGTSHLLHSDYVSHLGDRESISHLLYQPGDGQVSKSSLLGLIEGTETQPKMATFKIKYPVFVCEDHLKLTGNVTFQDNLLHVLMND